VRTAARRPWPGGTRGRLLPLAAALLAAAAAARAEPPLAPGQEWRYRTRPHETASTLVVARIDDDPELGRVVHVSLRGLRLRHPRLPGGMAGEVAHLAFTEAALQGSLLALVGHGLPVPGFDRDYEQWRRHRGGAHRVPVRDALDRLEGALVW
jgi:hypothetical protein